MQRFKNSWAAFKTSCSVIAANKSLLLFPITTTALTAVMALFFLAPIALMPTGHRLTEKAHWEAVGQTVFTSQSLQQLQSDKPEEREKPQLVLSGAGKALFAVFYFLSMFLATFFNVAFFHEILDALHGRPVSVREGLTFACTRLRSILLWSLFTGIVGWVIRSLEERVGFFGKWVVALIGVAWSVASVFAVPVLVVEPEAAGPLLVLRKSSDVIRKTWGEALIGFEGLQFGGVLVVLFSVVFLAAAGYASYQLQSAALLFGSIVAWLASAAAFSYLAGVVGLVYQGALFVYATEGVMPQAYTQEQLELAWKRRKA